jgi:hypothetical protein
VTPVSIISQLGSMTHTVRVMVKPLEGSDIDEYFARGSTRSTEQRLAENAL